MKGAVVRLELVMGARLKVVSGYRTAGYQAQLCQWVAGPCAPPGRSMHQAGLAVDVTNWTQTLPHLSAVGVCQPLPAMFLIEQGLDLRLVRVRLYRDG